MSMFFYHFRTLNAETNTSIRQKSICCPLSVNHRSGSSLCEMQNKFLIFLTEELQYKAYTYMVNEVWTYSRCLVTITLVIHLILNSTSSWTFFYWLTGNPRQFWPHCYLWSGSWPHACPQWGEQVLQSM